MGKEVKKVRMEEPWGYREENDYQSNMPSNVGIEGLFSKATYDKDKNKMFFYDKYNVECGTIDVSEFEEESIVKKAYYDTNTKQIIIEFVNGDVVKVDVADVLDENEFKDGLQVNSGVVSVLIDGTGEGYEGNPYLSTSEGGVKIAGIDKHIEDAVEAERVRAVAAEEALDEKIDAETQRAQGEESRIEAKLDQEIADRIADVDAEETRAKAEEAAANRRIDTLNDALDAEKTIREAGDTTEKNRATEAEAQILATMNEKFTVEEQAREGGDNALDAKITALEDTKADKDEIPTDFYTQEEVNKMMSQLLTRIENLEATDGVIVADDASAVAAAVPGSNLVLTSTDAIQALTENKEYNTLTIVGGNSNVDIKGIASDKITVDGMTINGDKGASNGRMQISADTVSIKNIEIESGATAYNVFESSQDTTKSDYFTKEYNVSNLICDNTELNHNILNIYTPSDNAVINIKDCKLNLDVDNSNLLRMANYTNATNVTINFENVEWTYENAAASDWGWAGLMIFQPSSSDVALSGDTSKIATWTVNVKDCKYNGEKVVANNFGEHNQVVYLYNINNSGAITDAAQVMTINFE